MPKTRDVPASVSDTMNHIRISTSLPLRVSELGYDQQEQNEDIDDGLIN